MTAVRSAELSESSSPHSVREREPVEHMWFGLSLACVQGGFRVRFKRVLLENMGDAMEIGGNFEIYNGLLGKSDKFSCFGLFSVFFFHLESN